MTTPAPVTVDIWSDVMCPWCIIGLNQLETALAGMAGEVEATVRFHPFELNPDMPETGEEQQAHIQRKYGRTPEQAAGARSQMQDAAAAAGYSFGYTGEGDPPPAMMWNTRAAHRLLAMALRDHGAELQVRLKRAMFDAHFQQRRRMNDPLVLTDIAASAGLVSMLADLSSEIVYPLFPIFVTVVLGAPVALLGLIEGIAEEVTVLLDGFNKS